MEGDGPEQKMRQTRPNERAPDSLGTLWLANWSCRVFNVYERVSWCPYGRDKHCDGGGVKADFNFLWIRI